MRRVLVVHPLRPGRIDDHHRWCDELRVRRDEVARSRQRCGIVRQVRWIQPAHEVVVLRTDGPDPLAALAQLAASDDPFDRWYAEREREIHGGPPLAPERATVELLTEYRNGDIDPFDMFIATALPIEAGHTDQLRQAVTVSTAGGGGLQRVRRWGLKRLAIWLHPTERGDFVIYESAGDIPEMVRSLTTDTDPLIAQQRSILDQVFGLHLADESFPVPLPAFAWSADDAPTDVPPVRGGAAHP